jgi:TnpA family transposase
LGLAYLLNITLIPRIRNWQDRKRYRPSASSRYQHIDSVFDVVRACRARTT